MPISQIVYVTRRTQKHSSTLYTRIYICDANAQRANTPNRKHAEYFPGSCFVNVVSRRQNIKQKFHQNKDNKIFTPKKKTKKSFALFILFLYVIRDPFSLAYAWRVYEIYVRELRVRYSHTHTYIYGSYIFIYTFINVHINVRATPAPPRRCCFTRNRRSLAK